MGASAEWWAEYRAKPEVKARRAELQREWRKKNREKDQAIKKSWKSNNPDKVATERKAYKERNSGIVRAQKARRRAAKLKATPAWADHEAIKRIYIKAAAMREAGNDVHVDHIIPLQGKLVCGLHVENNLQILEASENVSKSNKFVV